ncbi:MAG TPA: hypothetical protein VFA71_14195 [Terriglobales bacterium]|nr:hypothetical protein [Terriglobales bacterium]
MKSAITPSCVTRNSGSPQDDELKENPCKWYQIIAFYQITGMMDVGSMPHRL